MTPDEREVLARRLMPLAQRMARGVAKIYPRVELSDLLSDAYFGVTRTLDKYDPDRGVPLEAFARRVISGAIMNGIRARDPVSETARQTIRKAEQYQRETLQQRDVGELVAELEDRLPQLREAITAAQRASTVVAFDVNRHADDRALANAEEDPAHIFAARTERAGIIALIEQLPEQERRVISLFYFSDMEPKHIGEKMNLTVQRIYQLRKKALGSLKERLALT